MKVKYISTIDYYKTLSRDNVYDVLKCLPSNSNMLLDKFTMMNDDGYEREYYWYNSDMRLIFQDVTIKYRNEIIDDILK